jgi:uncharacterized protein (TIGR02453 family)
MQFQGFSQETIKFFSELKVHNTKEWFNDNRGRFDSYVMDPAKKFVVDMGERLRSIAPGIHAIPKVDASIFRLHRDVRFSADKSPYKTHLGIYLWEGERKKLECPGFYFHLEPPNLMLGCGLYMFTPEILPIYRDAVVDKKMGKSLQEAIDKVQSNFAYQPGGKKYKKIPSGYDPEHPNAQYLLHNGLHIGEETGIPDELLSTGLIDYCYSRYEIMAPLHRWLLDLVNSM